ncbi:DUF6248 family natural product biosynthesis protein [Streptomyces luteolifulvus]|uniref:DUF6248 family natural product biosynthesis protein n=1 Tax=Streptomyces luteolifulvus TaxID=2615112 RepID=UPI001CDA0A45
MPLAPGGHLCSSQRRLLSRCVTLWSDLTSRTHVGVAWSKPVGAERHVSIRHRAHSFHSWCSNEQVICHPCGPGHHDQCVSASGARLVRRHHHRPRRIRRRRDPLGAGQRPCRWFAPAPPVDGGTVDPPARPRTFSLQCGSNCCMPSA